MIKEGIGTGATIEEAQTMAITELAAPAGADIQIEVLEMPVKKTLGIFGGSPAKVRAFYEDGKKEQKNEPKAEIKKEIVEEKEPEKEVLSDIPDDIKPAYDYLLNMIKGIGFNDPQIEMSKSEKEYFFDISCSEDCSILIGRRGETLDSIQYLVRLVANRGKSEDDYTRISVNVGNYRQKREETLKEIARKNASRVRKYGRNAVLDPMTPYERRIIHTEVAKIEGVSSHSVGSDNERKVVITLAEGVKPLHASSTGGYNGNNNRPRGGYNNNHSKPGYKRNNNSYSPQEPREQRAPRSDFDGETMYGKIK